MSKDIYFYMDKAHEVLIEKYELEWKHTPEYDKNYEPTDEEVYHLAEELEAIAYAECIDRKYDEEREANNED